MTIDTQTTGLTSHGTAGVRHDVREGDERPLRRHRLWSRPAVPVLVLLAALGVCLGACGGGTPSSSGVASIGGTTTTASSTPPPTGPRNSTVKYVKCMRTHGLPNFPYPKSTGNGGSQFSLSGLDPTSPTFQRAQHACSKFMRGSSAGANAGTSKAVLLRYAKCMREHGVSSFPDPTKFPVGGWGFDLVGQVTQTSPAFQRANRACRNSSYGGIHPCGGSGGGSKERRC